MNLYLVVLKALLDPNLYSQFNAYIDYDYIKQNHPEIWRLYQSLHYLQKVPATTPFGVVDLQFAFETNYPGHKKADFAPLFQQLEEATFSKASLQDYLLELRKRKLALAVAKTALAVNEGHGEDAAMEEAIAALTVVQTAVELPNDFGEMSLESILASEHLVPGLLWRLPSLNKTLGSLRTGNFGFVFARPETGKTTFLSSEIPYMASQSTSKVLLFNNEQAHGDVLKRMYQGALGWTILEVLSKPKEAERRFMELTKGNFQLISEANLSRRRIEQICARHNPSLIVFDQIDKIHGFDSDRNDLELTAIYQWSRELSKTYGPTIGICQAGQSAEGKRWLTMNDVNNSKTGKQGEADFILGIGKSHDAGLETFRYMHLSKNKLTGDHGKWEVRIRPEIARYEDL